MNKNQNDNNELNIKQQQIAQIIAGLLLCLIFVFISGYYLGKKRAIEAFTDRFENDSFADKMAYSICSIYDTGDTSSSSESNDNDSEEESTENQEPEAESELQEENENSDNNNLTNKSINQETKESQKTDKKYFAQLAGFGTEKAALKCADQITRKGLPVKVKEKISKSLKGRSVKWYQVITQDYDDEQQLINRIDKISKSVKLKDVKIEQLEGQKS